MKFEWKKSIALFLVLLSLMACDKDSGSNFVSTYVLPDDPNMYAIFEPLITAGLLNSVTSQDGPVDVSSTTPDTWDVEQAYFIDVSSSTDLFIQSI